jgi:hypothetical protein
MSEKLSARYRAELEAAGDERMNVIVRTAGPPEAVAAQCEARGFKIRHTYKLLPGLAVSAPASSVIALADDPAVTKIEPDRTVAAL